MGRISIQLFGSFEARTASGDVIHLPTRKAEALVAYLVVRPGQIYTREKLAALLWGFSGSEQARQSLRQTLFSLRKALRGEEPVLTTLEDKVSIDPDRVDADVIRFQQSIREGTRKSIEDAIALQKGEFLEGFVIDEPGFDDWLNEQRETLREIGLHALRELLEIQTESGAVADAVITALQLLSRDPLQESVHRHLMQLYVKQGRPESAIKQYQTCADVLRRQLRVEPADETRQLFESIARQRHEQSTEEGSQDEADAGAPPRARSVLVIEDNVLHQNLIRSILPQEQYSVTVAGDGAKALIELGATRYDLILLDVSLPYIDGLTLLEAIRKHGIDTPTILLTAHAGDESEVRGLELGASDFMRKPISRDVLLMRIEKALRARPVQVHG
ncbi:MAG: response regulator [Thermoanaerobaculia bacterium]